MMEPGSARIERNFLFTNWTYLSACPFEDGLYGALNLCLMPFAVHHCLNSVDLNCSPLSDTRTFGSPNLLKMPDNIRMVLADVNALCIACTSIHFEYESTKMRKWYPKKGPAKSICRRAHGSVVASHG